MDHVTKANRWLDRYIELAQEDRARIASKVSSGRRRELTYHYKGNKFGPVTCCDSWFSKMSRLCKQLKSVGVPVLRPEVIIFGQHFGIEEEASAAADNGDLTYQFMIIGDARVPGDGVDSWH